MDTKIFDNSLFFAEEGIRSHIGRLLEKKSRLHLTLRKSTRRLRRLKRFGDSHDAIQKRRFTKLSKTRSLSSQGTGDRKDNCYQWDDQRLCPNPTSWSSEETRPPDPLAAPTGRAARRMNDWQDFERHHSPPFGMTGDDDTSHLEDYLDADFIIVDEFSMVDTWLANQLLQQYCNGYQTWLWEMLTNYHLSALVRSWLISCRFPSIPQTKLEHIFRQSEDSTIVSLAGDIRQGKLPQDFTERKADRSYFEARKRTHP